MKNLRHGKAGGFSSMRTRPTKSSGLPVPESETKVTLQIEGHRTVLLHEAVSSLNIKPMDTIVDATLGGAGHALSMANLLNEKGTFVGFDLDSDALERSKKILAGVKPRPLVAPTHYSMLLPVALSAAVVELSMFFDLPACFNASRICFLVMTSPNSSGSFGLVAR